MGASRYAGHFFLSMSQALLRPHGNDTVSEFFSKPVPPRGNKNDIHETFSERRRATRDGPFRHPRRRQCHVASGYCIVGSTRVRCPANRLTGDRFAIVTDDIEITIATAVNSSSAVTITGVAAVTGVEIGIEAAAAMMTVATVTAEATVAGTDTPLRKATLILGVRRQTAWRLSS
jgi:hypothetical protein